MYLFHTTMNSSIYFPQMDGPRGIWLGNLQREMHSKYAVGKTESKMLVVISIHPIVSPLRKSVFFQVQREGDPARAPSLNSCRPVPHILRGTTGGLSLCWGTRNPSVQGHVQ